jgi:hypothetical protein
MTATNGVGTSSSSGTSNSVTVNPFTNVGPGPIAGTKDHTRVVITLTGGSFKAGTLSATDFTFVGANATGLAAGTYTRTSDTVVTITNILWANGQATTVTVKAATQATQATSVAGQSFLT